MTPTDKTLYELAEVACRCGIAACGDRAAEVLAAQARWARWGPAPAARATSRTGGARRRLGVWLVELGTRHRARRNHQQAATHDPTGASHRPRTTR